MKLVEIIIDIVLSVVALLIVLNGKGSLADYMLLLSAIVGVMIFIHEKVKR